MRPNFSHHPYVCYAVKPVNNGRDRDLISKMEKVQQVVEHSEYVLTLVQ